MPKIFKVVKGFTLVELLVVIAIIAILSTIGAVIFTNVQKSTQLAKVKADMQALKTAIILLETRTGLSPGKLEKEPCIQNPEVFLNSCTAGIGCTDGGFPNWGGPYMNPVPKDSWGREYFFDPDYTCNGVTGCESVPNGTVVRAINSAGPNGLYEYGGDDIVLILCK